MLILYPFRLRNVWKNWRSVNPRKDMQSKWALFQLLHLWVTVYVAHKFALSIFMTSNKISSLSFFSRLDICGTNIYTNLTRSLTTSFTPTPHGFPLRSYHFPLLLSIICYVFSLIAQLRKLWMWLVKYFYHFGCVLICDMIYFSEFTFASGISLTNCGVIL